MIDDIKGEKEKERREAGRDKTSQAGREEKRTGIARMTAMTMRAWARVPRRGHSTTEYRLNHIYMLHMEYGVGFA